MLIYYCLGTTFNKYIGRPLLSSLLDEEEEEEASEKKQAKTTQNGRVTNHQLVDDEGESEEEGGPFFLSLGVPHLVAGRKYLPDDPEWREFVKISNNKEKLMEIEGEWRISPSWTHESICLQVNR